VRRQAVRQVAAAVDLLGHHPSIVVWCGHDEPFSHELPAGRAPGPTRVFRSAVAQALPGWNKSVLDTSIKRALERADPTRLVLAHSGMLPHPAWGTDSHLYFGWYHGSWDDLPRAMAAWPAAGRFVGELGAQAVPCTSDFMEPERWPNLDWDRLATHYCMQKSIFDDLVPPSDYATFEAWRDASQAYQARLVSFQVESLRRLRFRPTGGFAVFLLNDSQPAVSWSLLDHERVPKAAYQALRQACAPVLVAADWPAPSYRPGATMALEVHVVNDLLEELEGAVVEARLAWPGGVRKWLFGGNVPANSVSFVGTLNARLPQLASLEADTGGNSAEASPWPLELSLELRWGHPPQSTSNHYESRLTGPRQTGPDGPTEETGTVAVDQA
jgi:beta-mannosidase